LDETLFCRTEADKNERAEGVVDLMFTETPVGQRVLDFGCGEGHVAKRLAAVGAKVVGYDPNPDPRWQDASGVTFTNSWQEAEAAGPYDFVLMYDVIDHIPGSEADVVAELLRAKGTCASGTILVRVHPWCSKTGGHFYEAVNKAYPHLVFTEEELATLGHPTHPVRKIIHPLMTYSRMFKEAGLTQRTREEIRRESVPPFFINEPLVSARIKANWRDSPDESLRNGEVFPAAQMEQQFIIYTLGR
jgi:2-polyprenyl-3-methyl-5-hydroxy-6-metoxy-1,4-benzoquinol methylase